MRLVRPLAIGFTSLGVVACTALLGDFDVAKNDGTSNTDGGGTDTGGSEAGAVSITPDQGKMGIFRALEFKANQDVTWSVQEPEAGTIDDKGVLLSGSKPGTYHVIATSKADPSQKATVPIVVTNLTIQVLVGPNGGAGNIDGPKKVAHFNTPQGVVGDYDQNAQTNRYFVADTANHTIRMYVENPQPTGAVTTIAGKAGESGTTDGAADIARFNGPSFMGWDTTGKKLYVVDNKGTCIRKIDLANGNLVSTFAGTCGTNSGAGTFSQIQAFAMSGDRQSWVYVCDSGVLKRVVSGIQSNPLSITGNCGLLTSTRGNPYGDIYFGTSQNGTVYRFYEGNGFPVASGNISTMVTGVQAGFNASMVQYNNTLFFANDQSVLFEVPNIGGTAQAFPASPSLGVLNDSRVVDSSDAKLVRLGKPAHLMNFGDYGVMWPDQAAHAIRRLQSPGFNSTTETIFGAAYVADDVDGPKSTARLTGPFSVTADDQGIVYFGDFALQEPLVNSTIRKFDRNTATVTTVAGLPTKPNDVNNLPVDGPHDQARFWFPIDMTYLKGKLYVIDNFANAVRSVDVANGDVKTIAGKLAEPGAYVDDIGEAARFNMYAYPSGSGASFYSFFGGAITTDGTDLFVSDSLNYVVRKINVATGATSTIAGSGIQGTMNNAVAKMAQFMDPIGLTYDNGFLYICDFVDNTIRRMNIQTGNIDTFIGLSGVAGDKDGDASTATLNGPYRIMADGIGNIYLTELQLNFNGNSDNIDFRGVIRRISLKDRNITTFAGTPGKIGLQGGPLPSTTNFPSAMARMPNHDLVFGDFTEATLAIIQPL